MVCTLLGTLSQIGVADEPEWNVFPVAIPASSWVDEFPLRRTAPLMEDIDDGSVSTGAQLRWRSFQNLGMDLPTKPETKTEPDPPAKATAIETELTGEPLGPPSAAGPKLLDPPKPIVDEIEPLTDEERNSFFELPEPIEFLTPGERDFERFDGPFDDDDLPRTVGLPPFLPSQPEWLDEVWPRAERLRDNALDQVRTWTNRIEMGGTLRRGIREEEGINTKGKFERKFDRSLLQFDIGGRYRQATGVLVENRWWMDGTFDFGKKDSWILFANFNHNHDDIKRLSYRGSLSTGVGYRFWDERDKRLILRFGPGVTHEIVRRPDRRGTTPDLFAELEFRWPWGDRVHLEQKTRVTPRLEDFNTFDSYRLQTESAILFDLDDSNQWQLKLGLKTIYDSTPAERNASNTDWITLVSIVYTRRVKKKK